MKKQTSCILLALTIFSLNALPASASKKTTKTNKDKKHEVVTSDEWCFELPQMGLFCYDL
jgi:hypothetical protein